MIYSLLLQYLFQFVICALFTSIHMDIQQLETMYHLFSLTIFLTYIWCNHLTSKKIWWSLIWWTKIFWSMIWNQIIWLIASKTFLKNRKYTPPPPTQPKLMLNGCSLNLLTSIWCSLRSTCFDMQSTFSRKKFQKHIGCKSWVWYHSNFLHIL